MSAALETRVQPADIRPGDLIRYPRGGVQPVSVRGFGGDVRVTWSEPRTVTRTLAQTDPRGRESLMVWFEEDDEFGQRFVLLVGFPLEMLLLHRRSGAPSSSSSPTPWPCTGSPAPSRSSTSAPRPRALAAPTWATTTPMAASGPRPWTSDSSTTGTGGSGSGLTSATTRSQPSRWSDTTKAPPPPMTDDG